MDVEYLEEYEDILRTCQMYDGMDYDENDLLRDFENHQRNNYNELIDTNNSFISYTESHATDTTELLNKNKSTIENEVKIPEFVNVNNDTEIIETENGSKIVSIRFPENKCTEIGSLKKEIEEKSKSSQILEKILGKCESKTKKKKLNDNQKKNSNDLACDSQYETENEHFDNLQKTINEDNKIITQNITNTLDFVDCGASYKIVNDIKNNIKPSDKQNVDLSIKSEIKEIPSENFVTNKKISTNETITKNIPEKSSDNDISLINNSVMKSTLDTIASNKKLSTTTTNESNKFSNSKQFSINEINKNDDKNETLITEQLLSETNFTKISETSDNVDISETEPQTTEIFVIHTKQLDNKNSKNNSIKNNVEKLTNPTPDNLSLLVPLNKKRGRKPKARRSKSLIANRIVNSPGLKMFNNKIKERKQIKNSSIQKSNKIISDSDNKNSSNSLKMKSITDIQMKTENILENNDKQKSKRKRLKVILKRLKIEDIVKLQKSINVTANTEIEKCTKNNKIINRKRKIDEISNVKEEVKKETKENNVLKLNQSKFDISKRARRIGQIKNTQQQISEKLPNKSQKAIKITLVQPAAAAATTTTTTTAVTEQISSSCTSDSNSKKTATIKGDKSILSQRRRQLKKQKNPIIQQQNTLVKQQKQPQLQQKQQNQINQSPSTSSKNTINPNIIMYEIPSFLFVETNFISRNAYERMKRMENFNENILLQTITKTSKSTISPITSSQIKIAKPLPIPEKQTIKRTIIEKRNIEIILDDIDELLEKHISKQVKNKLEKISEGFTINNENIKQQIDNIKCKKELILENSEFDMENLNKILKFLKIYFRSNSIKEPTSNTSTKTTSTSTITTTTTTTTTTATISSSSLSSSTSKNTNNQNRCYHDNNTNLNQINNEEFRFRKITLPSSITSPTTSTTSKIVSINLNSNEEIILPDNLINYKKIINNTKQNSIILPNSQKINNKKTFLTSTPISKYQSETRKVSSTITTTTTTTTIKPPILSVQQNIPSSATTTTTTSTSSSTTINKQAPPILAVAPILSSSSPTSSSVGKINNSEIPLDHIDHENETSILDNDRTHNNTNTNNIALLSTIQNDTNLESSSSSLSSSTLTTRNVPKYLTTETENSVVIHEDNNHKLTSISPTISSSTPIITITTTSTAATTSLKNNYNENYKPTTPPSPSSSLSSSSSSISSLSLSSSSTTATPRKYFFRCQKCDSIQRSRPLMQDHIQKVHFKNSNNCFICHVPLKSNYLKHFMLNHSNTTKYTKK